MTPEISVVGAGLMGRWHLTYARRLGARLVAVADPDPARAAELARPHDAEAVREPGDWLRRSDVVHICSPTPTHDAWIERALVADSHVVVEKPLATTPEAAARLLALARERRLQLVPVHQFPYQRGYRRLRERLGSLGEIVDVGYRVQTAGAEIASPERRRRVLLELIPHGISLFRGLGFDDESTDAWKITSTGSEELVLSRSEASSRLTMTFSTIARPPINQLRVAGSRASAQVDLFHGFSTFDRLPTGRVGKLLHPFLRGARELAGATLNLGGRALRRETAYPGLTELLRSVYASLGSDRPLVAPEEILIAQQLIARAESQGD